MSLSAHYAIARTTYREVLRQPVFAIVLGCGLVSQALTPFLTAFSLTKEVMLVKEVGLSTLLLSGVVLACVGASHTVRRELELRTTIVLLSKPVSREGFLWAKFAGLGASLGLACLVLALALVLASREAAGGAAGAHSGGSDSPVVVASVAAGAIALSVAAFANHRRGASFSAAAVKSCAAALLLAVLAVAFFDASWHPQRFGAGYDPLVAFMALEALLAVLVAAAFAVGVAVWAPSGMTLLLTTAFFLAALTRRSWAFGWLGIFRVLPDLQLFWLGDLCFRSAAELPAGYILASGAYGALYAVGIVGIGSLALRWRGL
jgi:hypothetical protein